MEKPKVDFNIGEDLYGVSLDELKTRISILNDEITRLEQEFSKKEREKEAANNLFGGKS